MKILQMRNPLLEEIREINQGLIDTVVDIIQENADPDAASEVGKGTIVKCSFSAVALCPNLKSHFASLEMVFYSTLNMNEGVFVFWVFLNWLSNYCNSKCNDQLFYIWVARFCFFTGKLQVVIYPFFNLN